MTKIINIIFLFVFLSLFSTSKSYAENSVPSLKLTTSELECTTADDCVLVPNACACSHGVFVNKDHKNQLETKLNSLCSSYSGIVCKMPTVYLWASCDNKQCTTHKVKNGECKKLTQKKHKHNCENTFSLHL